MNFGNLLSGMIQFNENRMGFDSPDMIALLSKETEQG